MKWNGANDTSVTPFINMISRLPHTVASALRYAISLITTLRVNQVTQWTHDRPQSDKQLLAGTTIELG